MKKYIYILSLITYTSCNFINPFYDEGKNIETIIELDDFTQIEINNIFNIEIVKDSESYIIYKGGERIFNEMKYSSLSGRLSLDHNFMNWTKNLDIPTLEIHLPLLESLDLKGSCNIKSIGQLHGDKLSIYVYDAADVYEIDFNISYNNLNYHSRGSGVKFIVQGKCPTASYVLNGSANLNATKLVSKNVTVRHNSLGNAHIYVEDKLIVTFFKSGDIYYKGSHSEIEVKYDQINNQDASGQLIKE